MNSTAEAFVFQGQAAVRLSTPAGAEAVVMLQGGQLVSWKPVGGKERLYLSEKAVFDGVIPIRGGVPVCFPQFSGQGPLPKHGLVRNRPWRLCGDRCGKEDVQVRLEITDSPEILGFWPNPFRAELSIGIEDNRLDIELEVENLGEASFEFTAALHTYLRVPEVESLEIHGLYHLGYRDAAQGDEHGCTPRSERAAFLQIDQAVDRVYHDVSRPLLLSDTGFSLGIQQSGFPDAVVWNPWEKAHLDFSDIAPLDFRHFVCIEAAVARLPQVLAPGEVWWGRQSLINQPDLESDPQ